MQIEKLKIETKAPFIGKEESCSKASFLLVSNRFDNTSEVFSLYINSIGKFNEDMIINTLNKIEVS